MNLEEIEETAMDVEKIERVLDTWYAEIKKTTDEIRNNPNADLVDISAYGDRWDAIRTDANLVRSKVWRIHSDAKALLDDAMREEISKHARRQSDFTPWEQKKATYETKHINHVIEVRKYSRVLTQLSDLLRFLQEKERWLDARRFNLHHNEKKEMHYSARENLIVD